MRINNPSDIGADVQRDVAASLKDVDTVVVGK